jgi:hypothetical protein
MDTQARDDFVSYYIANFFFAQTQEMVSELWAEQIFDPRPFVAESNLV